MNETQPLQFLPLSGDDRLRVAWPGEVSRGEEMALRGTDPESSITEYILVYEDMVGSQPVQYSRAACRPLRGASATPPAP